MKMDVLLLVEVESHHVIFPKIFDFALFIDELAFLIFQLLLGYDPIVVDAFTLLLEVG